MTEMNQDYTEKGLITLTLEDNSVISLQPLVVIGIAGKEYMALASPIKESEDMFFYQFIEQGENKIELLNIDDPEILELVLDEFEKWFDNQIQLEQEE